MKIIKNLGKKRNCVKFGKNNEVDKIHKTSYFQKSIIIIKFIIMKEQNSNCSVRPRSFGQVVGTVKTASVYFREGKTFVSAKELVEAFSEHGYCNHFKAEQILGKCHQENCIVDETYMRSSRFNCEKGNVMRLWKQDDGNQAVPMLVFSKN